MRVFNGTDAAGKWSPVNEALPIRVGEVVLECAAGSSSGNFGTLKFPRTDVPTANQIPANIALGLQSPLSPTIHQWAVANPTLAGTCSNGVNGALTAPNGAVTLVPGVNCVDTDTGLAANVATEGLVQGGTYGQGVLREDTTTGCDPTGGSANRILPIHRTRSINNDVLTCFFTNGTTSIAGHREGELQRRRGARRLDPERRHASSTSPFWPSSRPRGGSNKYSIIDFRAAFLTDETATTSSIKGSHTGTADNGVWVQGQDIKQIKVVFFNDDALPIDGDIPLIDYLGTGNRVIRLID